MNWRRVLAALGFRRRPLTAHPGAVEIPWLELCDSEGRAVGSLVVHPPETRARVLDELRANDPGPPLSIPPAVLRELLSTSRELARSLRQGRMFHIVGPPEIVAGLNSGTLTMIRTESGLLGTVVRADSHRIVGHARLARVSAFRVAGPLLAWNLLHAVAATGELRAINRRLMDLQRGIERLQLDRTAEAVGTLRWVRETLDDLAAEEEACRRLGLDGTVRLCLAEEALARLQHKLEVLSETFESRLTQAKEAGAKAVLDLLSAEGEHAAHDMELLAASFALRLRVCELRIRLAAAEQPEDLPRRVALARETLARYRRAVEGLPSLKAALEDVEAQLKALPLLKKLLNKDLVRRADALDGLFVARGPQREDGDAAPWGVVLWQEGDAIRAYSVPVEPVLSGGTPVRPPPGPLSDPAATL